MLPQKLRLVVIFLTIGGCGPNVVKHTCLGGGASDSPLLTGAALLRLDVYDATAHCTDGLLSAGGGAPIMSHSYAAGQAIKLDVPPGPHAIVLTTFSDSDATEPLGQGCTESTLEPGSQMCFDLVLAEVPDGGVIVGGGSGDCPTGFADCDHDTRNGCETQLGTTSNCGGCGNVCDSTHSQGAACVNSACTYASCSTGFADCNTTAPNTDGCETDLGSSVDNCGACGRTCSATNVGTRQCTDGTCNSTCKTGFGNCSLPAAGTKAPYTADDGCESNLTTCTGMACCTMTMPTPANMCAPPVGGHINGLDTALVKVVDWSLGQTYADCHAPGVPGNPATYTLAMANAAMAAVPGTPQPAATCGTIPPGSGTPALCVWKAVKGLCTVWCYTNDTTNPPVAGAGHVYQNDAQHSPNGTCNGTTKANTPYCPDENDPTWN